MTLNMAVVPTDIIWKWQQYGNNCIAVFPLSPHPSKMIYNLSANNPVAAVEIKVTFNKMSFEQSVPSSFNSQCPPRRGKFVGLISVKE